MEEDAFQPVNFPDLQSDFSVQKEMKPYILFQELIKMTGLSGFIASYCILLYKN